MEICKTQAMSTTLPKLLLSTAHRPLHFKPNLSLSLPNLKHLRLTRSMRRLHLLSVPRATLSEDEASCGGDSVVVVEEDGFAAGERNVNGGSSGPTQTEHVAAKEESSNDGQFNMHLDDFGFKLDSEDTLSILLYAGGSLAALYLASAVVGAIDSIPLLPKLMEAVGLGYSIWFTTRYLLFKENREELAAKIEELKQQVLGSNED